MLVRERPATGRWSCSISGDEVTVQAGEEGIRFLLVSGKPIEEPVAWYGPIVMNTQAELQQAVAELNNGTFIRPSSIGASSQVCTRPRRNSTGRRLEEPVAQPGPIGPCGHSVAGISPVRSSTRYLSTSG